MKDFNVGSVCWNYFSAPVGIKQVDTLKVMQIHLAIIAIADQTSWSAVGKSLKPGAKLTTFTLYLHGVNPSLKGGVTDDVITLPVVEGAESIPAIVGIDRRQLAFGNDKALMRAARQATFCSKEKPLSCAGSPDKSRMHRRRNQCDCGVFGILATAFVLILRATCRNRTNGRERPSALP